MLGTIIDVGLKALDKIPTGKGKRKAAIEFMRPEIQGIAQIRGLLEAAANSGGAGDRELEYRLLSARLGVTQSIMQVTADAIGDDTPEDK